MNGDAIVPGLDERAELARLADLLETAEGRELALVRDGIETELPGSMREVFARLVQVLASGRGVAIVPVDQELTTREAAELLGVSRPTLIKLLDDGEIPYSRPNSSRRIPLGGLLAYKQQRSHARRQLLAEMTADAVDSGMYGTPANSDERDVA
ncbi:helix-turn-helix domain-containing protein [Solwaraspora sp. WMMA2080]|uniref:helix-turn-helix domain-containing protein n=1 Tax=unclassified Solwaraspora TaxID=2627926 RepID=UPI00248C2912|nr:MULTISPECIES: helix-turn-helix domain-containing protein [unclassified Solwaraspora]WBB95891.1 helix-turn-helix domain-containing protein [Solwaraspora sp. WMMA2059]WBC20205.1 helix-turn-helix domain-containing protein [Solwaraspora sp. WMMA2080]